MQSTADSYSSLNAVDIFNSATGTWSTAQLSMKRRALGATSVGKVVLFAGGGVSDGTFVQLWRGYVVDCAMIDRIRLQQQFCCVLLAILSMQASVITRCRCEIECSGFVQQYNRDVVDSSAQRGAP
jgi:hypothetical protein